MISKLQMMKRRLIVEPLYLKAKEIESPTCSPGEVSEISDMLQSIWECNFTLHNGKAPLVLSWIEITNAKFWFEKAVVIRKQADVCLCIIAKKSKGKKASSPWPTVYDETSKKHPDVYLQDRDEIWEYEYVEVQPEHINKFYENRCPNIKVAQLRFPDGQKLHQQCLKVIVSAFAYLQADKLKEETS